MTRKEALEVIKSHPFLFASFPDDVIEALDVLIKQEPALDKIQEEIKRVDIVCHASNNHDELIRKNVVLQIIDKYRAESYKWVNFADDLMPIIDEAESEEK